MPGSKASCRIAAISPTTSCDGSTTAASSPGIRRIDLKLIDELGDERTALAWLAKEKNVDTKLPVRDYELHSRFSDLPFLHAAAAAVLDAAGLNALAQRLDAWGAVDAVERFNLDGLLALWHPAGAN